MPYNAKAASNKAMSCSVHVSYRGSHSMDDGRDDDDEEEEEEEEEEDEAA